MVIVKASSRGQKSNRKALKQARLVYKGNRKLRKLLVSVAFCRPPRCPGLEKQQKPAQKGAPCIQKQQESCENGSNLLLFHCRQALWPLKSNRNRRKRGRPVYKSNRSPAKTPQPVAYCRPPRSPEDCIRVEEYIETTSETSFPKRSEMPLSEVKKCPSMQPMNILPMMLL